MSDPRPDGIPVDAFANVPCPACGERRLEVETRLTPKDIGTFGLAGQTMKFPATWQYWVICRACGVESRGKADPPPPPEQVGEDLRDGAFDRRLGQDATVGVTWPPRWLDRLRRRGRDE